MGERVAPRCVARSAGGGVLLALAAAVVGLGCGEREDRVGSGGPATRGGTAIVGMRTDFGGFNPVTASDQYADEVNKYALFTPLIAYDSALNVRPWLAQSWKLLGDSGVDFRLRRDVHWHDGRPVTAEDVKFTFDLAKDPATASLIGSAYLTSVARAEVVDSYTVRFTFVAPHAQALEDFWWAPVPRHVLEGVPPGELRNAEFNRRPVGSGPFRVVEWRANDRVVLERNAAFPEGLGGPANLERVVLRIVPEPATLLTELMTGGVHVDVPVEPDQAADIKVNRGLRLHAFPGRTVYYIGWNNRRPPFTDAAVRRAMTLGINRLEIIQALLFGYGQVATGPIPPWSPFYAHEVEPLPYDPEESARLLEGAGWVDRNGDGVREDAGGRPLRFTLLTSERPLNRAVAEVVQAQLRGVGVAVELRVLEFQTLLAQHRAREFDAVFANWVLDNFQVASAPVALFHSKLADVPRSTNRSGVHNPRLDALMDQGAATSDPVRGRVIWAEFTQLLRQEQPFTFMFWLDELAAAQARLGGVVMDPRGELQSMAEWSLPR
ncbi:MAG: hypothetical protein HY703_02985 [Gemmatimonadetes bacterium]|nr:hypothetical protein [Gemmatimonadota bacterium]